VNDFSASLGEDGRRAVQTLIEVHRSLHPGAPALARSVYA